MAKYLPEHMQLCCAVHHIEHLQLHFNLQQDSTLLIGVYQYRRTWKRNFWEDGSAGKETPLTSSFHRCNITHWTLCTCVCVLSMLCIKVNFMKKQTNTLVIIYVINHSYMFRSPPATIFRVYSIKEYHKKLCVANLSKIWIYKML
jgi:hypothetical protein